MNQEIIDRFMRSTTQRGRADAEEAIWQAASLEERLMKKTRHNWRTNLIVHFTGQSTYLTNMRNDLRLAGDAAEPLWPAIDDGRVTFSEAMNIVRTARRALIPGSMADRVLYYLNGQRPAARSQPPKSHANGAVAPRRIVAQPTDEVSKSSFWKELRATTRMYMEERLAKLDAPTRDRIRRDFETELHDFIRRMTERVGAASLRPLGLTELKRVSRTELTTACDALGIERPKQGTCVPPKDIKKQFRRAARTNHPDVGGPADGMMRILEARKVLELYNEQLAGGTVTKETDDNATDQQQQSP